MPLRCHLTRDGLYALGLHAVISTDDGTGLYLDKFGEFQESSSLVLKLLDEYRLHTGRPFIFSARQLRLRELQQKLQVEEIRGGSNAGARGIQFHFADDTEDGNQVKPLKWAVDEE